MKWIRFTIQTTTEAEDIIISDLYDIGLEGAQIEDKIPLTPLEKEQMFVDILPETEEDDGVAYSNHRLKPFLGSQSAENGLEHPFFSTAVWFALQQELLYLQRLDLFARN